MSFFGKLFRKEETIGLAPELEPMTIYAPLSGRAMPLKDVPDEVFSQGVLGPGCGIEPDGDTVYAPFNGEVIQTTDTKHAVGLKSTDGMELLIHVGMDTVDMNGKGFNCLVKEGQKVNMGDKLMTFSLTAIKAANHPATTAVILTNSDDVGSPKLITEEKVQHGDKLMKVTK